MAGGVFAASLSGPERLPELVTERLVLRELVPGDAPAVASGAGDRRVAQYLIAVPSPYPIALARRWVRHRIEWWEAGRGVTFAIAARGRSDELLGTVSLRRYVRDRRAELGYWLAARAWGRGLATEAARAIVAFAFDELRLPRLICLFEPENTASRRVAEKVGMTFERMAVIEGDEGPLYSMTRPSQPTRDS